MSADLSLSLLMVGVAVATGVAALRWLRISQREHYEPVVTLFAFRWWRASLVNTGLALLGVAGAIGVWIDQVYGWAAVLAQVGPIGLGLRGRTSKLAWTPRLIRLALVVGVVMLALVVYSWRLAAPGRAVIGLVLLPAIIDLLAWLLAPIERLLGRKWVKAAQARVAAVGAQVVAVTGSYGKTSTKAYVAHLLGGLPKVLASPASFNNRMGLARAINENLTDGTKVFVAEMGTYGPGEIADLVSWLPPRVAVITAIGPVHLERFGTEERIVNAKREIVDGAETLVVNVDYPALTTLASEEASRRRVITCSSQGADAEVTVGERGVSFNGESLGAAPESALGGNVACAVAAALAMGATEGEISHRLPGLPVSAHRRAPITSADGGFAIIDDTYNANPAGAAAALAMLDGAPGRKVVVTPGMVELGSRQKDENRAFAARASQVADNVIVVGKTNRSALVAGASSGKAEVLTVRRRQEAVEWVKSHLGPGDVVLYENDLPDNYP